MKPIDIFPPTVSHSLMKCRKFIECANVSMLLVVKWLVRVHDARDIKQKQGVDSVIGE